MSEETDYTVDSDGNTKVDQKGRAIPRYELDNKGKPKRDKRGKPVVKRRPKATPKDDEYETEYSVDSLGDIK